MLMALFRLSVCVDLISKSIIYMQHRLLLLIPLLVVITSNNYCQEPEMTKVYEIRNTIAVYPCYLTGKRVYKNDRFSNPPLGAKFMLVRPLSATNDTLIIRYLKWTKKRDSTLIKYYNEPMIISEWDSTKKQSLNDPFDKEGTIKARPQPGDWEKDPRKISRTNNYGDSVDKYFMIQRYDLDSNCIKVYNSGIKSMVFTIGLVTMPLKLRLGRNFDFQGNLSLGTTAGIKIRMSKYSFNYINFLLGTSISTISLDSFNTQGKVNGQPITNIAVFSPSFGVVFEFGKAQ